MEQENIGRYRREAERLRIEAEAVRDTELRRQYLEIATEYDRLADSIMRIWGGAPLTNR